MHDYDGEGDRYLDEEMRAARRALRQPNNPGVRRAVIPRLTDILRTRKEVYEATRYKVLTESEARVVAAYLSLQTTGNLTWAATGRLAGCSRQTAQRVFARVVRRLCKAGAEPLKVHIIGRHRIRIRGERRTEMRTEYQARLGTAWSRRWLESGSREELNGALPDTRVRTLVRASSMSTLIAALLEALTNREASAATRAAHESADWKRNLEWARRRIRSTHRKALPTAASDICRLLLRGCQSCGYCHTPILAGCWLDGRRVNKRRRYCCDACKMTARRRRPAS